MSFNKVFRVVRDPVEFEEVTQFFRQNYSLIKEIYLSGVANSVFPNFSWLDFSDYCLNTIKVVDKNCTISKVDMAYIATNVELVDVGSNPDRDLNRYEFLEILVRLANDKYRVPKICDSFAGALRNLFKDCLVPNYKPPFMW